MNKSITFLPKSLLKNYIIKNFSHLNVDDFFLIYDKIDIPIYLFEKNNILNSNSEVLFKVLDKNKEAYSYFSSQALTEQNINKIASSEVFIRDEEIEKFPQLLTNINIVKKSIERYDGIIEKIPLDLINKELIEFLEKSFYTLTKEEILSNSLFLESNILVKKSIKKYPDLILDIKEPSDDIMWYAKECGFEPTKEHFYSNPQLIQSKSLLLKAFENDPSIIVFFNENLLSYENIKSACERNYIATEKDLLKNPSLCKIGSIMELAISNNPILIRYVKGNCFINCKIVEEAIGKYRITKEDILKNPDIAKNCYIMNFLPEYKLFNTHLQIEEKEQILEQYLDYSKDLSSEEIPFLDYNFGSIADVNKLNALKKLLFIEIDEKNLDFQQESSQTLDKIIDGIVNIKYVKNKFTFRFPDIVSLNDSIIDIFSNVNKSNNLELLSQLVNNLYEFVGKTLEKEYIENQINTFYKIFNEKGPNGFYTKNENNEIVENITTEFYNKILNQHRNHFMSSEKMKIINEILPQLQLTEKKANGILNGRKIEKIKILIINKEFKQLGISEIEFDDMLNSVKRDILSNKDIKKLGIVITEEQLNLINIIYKVDGKLNAEILKNNILNIQNDEVIKFIVNKYEQIKFKLVKDVQLLDTKKYISDKEKRNLNGINPTNFIIGDNSRFKRNLAKLLLKLDDEKLNDILTNKDLLHEVKHLLPFVDLHPDFDINVFIKIIVDYHRIREKIVNKNKIDLLNNKNIVDTKIDDVINLANAYSSLDDISLFALGRNIVSIVDEINGEKYLNFYLKMLQKQVGNIPPVSLEISDKKYESGVYSDVERLLVGKVPKKDSCIDLLNSAGYGTFEEVLLKNSGDVILVRNKQNQLLTRILLFRRGNVLQMATSSREGISIEIFKQIADLIMEQSIINNDNIDYIFVNEYSAHLTNTNYSKIEDDRFIKNFSHADVGKGAYLISSKNMMNGSNETDLDLKFDEEPKCYYQKSRKKISYEPTESDISRIRALSIVMEINEIDKENKSREFEPFYIKDYSKVICGEDWYIAITKDGKIEELILPTNDPRTLSEIEEIKESLDLNSKAYKEKK